MVNDPVATEDMIVLASSRKDGGRCIAGLGLDSDSFVRPVGAYNSELYIDDCDVDGNWPEPLDFVRFGHEGHDGSSYQPENLTIDGRPWEMLEKLSPTEIQTQLEPHIHTRGPLLGNFGKAVPDHVAAEGMDASLAVIEPAQLGFEKQQVDYRSGFRLRVSFQLASRAYELSLTDYEVSARLQAQTVGSYSLEQLGFPSGRTLLTVSLGKPYQGWHYKLVAAVLRFP